MFLGTSFFYCYLLNIALILSKNIGMAKVALITGCAARIGRELAIHLAGAGWDLALHYNSSVNEISALEGELKSRYPNLRFKPFQANLESLDHASEHIIREIT